ncbi:MAG: hypothetical protein L0027_12535 [Candidatus Rokubacteria bacterium]|nr:hypothetical protein [Candidatus Rokubacteria bacterium]
MSRPVIALNAVLALAAALLAVQLVRLLAAAPPLPAPRPAATARPAGAEPAGGAEPAQRDRALGGQGSIVAKNIFSPTRTEGAAVQTSEPAVAPPAPKPFLFGVIVDDGKSRAFLEDPATKRVFGYTLGDSVGGGRLEAIRGDRVVIARPEGAVEVLLRDPLKPRPVPPAGPPGPGAPGPARGPRRPGVGQQPPVPGAAGQPPIAGTPRGEGGGGVGLEQGGPQTPRPVPPGFLRRPPVASPNPDADAEEE